MISVNIASLVEREEQLINTVESIINQVDVVNICLNNYTHNPFEGNEKVNVIFSDNEYTDASKFIFVNSVDGYYLTLDDDLQVGETYVQDTIKECDKYGIVSYHSRSFLKFPIDSYYKSPAIRCRCLDDYDYTEDVQIAGSGVMCFNTNYFKPPMSIFKTGCMADIYVSIYADSLGKKIWCLKHKKGYIKYQDLPIGTTIYEQKELNCETETAVVNQYYLNKK